MRHSLVLLCDRPISVTMLSLCTALAACNGPDCGLIGAPQPPMFQVTVVDAATGHPAWWGAQGYIEDGDFREDLHPSSTDPADSLNTLPLFSFGSRLGTYTVTVAKPGYQSWSATGLVVEKDGCFLTTHLLEAVLVPAP